MRNLVVIFGVCANGAWAEVPRVSVDIAPVHSIVAAVMGELGQPDLIVPPGASPHGYSMRPSEARALDQADLVFWMGSGLSPWLEGPIESLAGDATALDLLARPETQVLEVRDGATFEADDHDHGHGGDDHDDHDDHGDDHDDHDDHGDDHDDHDDHGDDHDDHDDHGDDHDDHDDHGDDHDDHDDHGDDHDDHDDHGDDHDDHDDHGDDHDDHDDHGDDHDDHDDHGDDHDDHDDHAEVVDPHAWLDPENARAWAAVIADELSVMDPDNAAEYAKNASTFSNSINELTDDIEAIVAPIRGRPFVVFHDAYHYFEHRFDVEAVGAISATDAAAPSAARVSELRDKVASLGAVCALTEPQFNPAILDALGEVKLGEVDPLGATLEVGPDLYGQLLTNMAVSLSNCLK
ncbi:zinc ABC transporter substrate-binding protein [Tateyamaria sp.]|uniref:zinc ABC transporter substrate-binding protein n=1 Tax=Tateyamaria sp. TaxID=1929288 RepID=UPI00329E10E7